MASQKSIAHKPYAQLLILIAVLALLFAGVSTQTKPAIAAGDPLDGEAQCQACLDRARHEWQQCTAMYDDEGDDHCESLYVGAVIECQSALCIL